MSVLGIFLNLPIVNRDEVTRTGPSPPPPSNLLYVVRHNRSKLNNVHGRCSELTAGLKWFKKSIAKKNPLKLKWIKFTKFLLKKYFPPSIGNKKKNLKLIYFTRYHGLDFFKSFLTTVNYELILEELVFKYSTPDCVFYGICWFQY